MPNIVILVCIRSNDVRKLKGMFLSDVYYYYY